MCTNCNQIRVEPEGLITAQSGFLQSVFNWNLCSCSTHNHTSWRPCGGRGGGHEPQDSVTLSGRDVTWRYRVGYVVTLTDPPTDTSPLNVTTWWTKRLHNWWVNHCRVWKPSEEFYWLFRFQGMYQLHKLFENIVQSHKRAWPLSYEPRHCVMNACTYNTPLKWMKYILISESDKNEMKSMTPRADVEELPESKSAAVRAQVGGDPRVLPRLQTPASFSSRYVWSSPGLQHRFMHHSVWLSLSGLRSFIIFLG